MNYRHIEVFRAVMVSGSLSGAAVQLRVAQPSLTRMVRRIEDLVGFALFDRVKGRLLPTAEGRSLFASVEHIQAQMEGLGDVIDQIARGGNDLFRLGASPSLARQLVPIALAAFHARFAEVRLHFDTVPLGGIVDYLALGIGECFLSMTPIEHRMIESRPIWPGQLVCLMPPSHPLASCPVVTAERLVGEKLIMCEADTPHGRLVREVFDEVGATPTVGVTARIAELAIGLSAAGLGIAIVDEFTAMDAASDRLVVRRMAGGPRFHVHINRSRDKVTSRFARTLEQMLLEILRTRAAADTLKL